MPIDRLPYRWKPACYRLREWLISDAPMYLGCAVIALVYAAANAPFFHSITPRIHPLAEVTEHEFWSALWALTGVGLLVSVVWEKYRLSTLSLSLWSALMMLWGMQYITTWAQGMWERGPSVGVVHIVVTLGVSWAVWRGSRAEYVLRDERGADATNTT